MKGVMMPLHCSIPYIQLCPFAEMGICPFGERYICIGYTTSMRSINADKHR